MTEQPAEVASPRKPLKKGEQPVRVEGYPGTWIVVSDEDRGWVEVGAEFGGKVLVATRKVHRGRTQWVDHD